MGETENAGTSLLNRARSARGLQPRVVLGLLLAGSLVGTWVTHAADPHSSRIVTWTLAVSMGVLTGGLYWRLMIFDEDSFDHTEHSKHVRDRWNSLETISVWGTILSGIAYLALGVSNQPLSIGAVVLGIALVYVLGLRSGIRWFTDEDSTRRRPALRYGLLVVGLVPLGAFAWLETGTTLLDWLVRGGHLAAFSLWTGGAVWHNFILLPTMRTHPDATDPLKVQARTFRRHLPGVIALLAVTGGYQTDRLIGLSPSALFDSFVGRLVGFKLLVLTVLTLMVVAKYKRTA